MYTERKRRLIRSGKQKKKEADRMITRFNSRTVYLGTDLKVFNEFRDFLDANHIKYKYKTTNRMGQYTGHGTARGNMGSAGMKTEDMYEYEILVHKEDFGKVPH